MSEYEVDYPFWIDLLYWLDYDVLGCRWEWFCSQVDGIQWRYRKDRGL